MSLMKAMQNGTYNPTQLMGAVGITCNGELRNASIGMGLDSLISLGEMGKEFDGNCDGIDALCYHLDIFTCPKAIAVLQKVLKRFEEFERLH